jgi:hypothetical protein
MRRLKIVQLVFAEDKVEDSKKVDGPFLKEIQIAIFDDSKIRIELGEQAVVVALKNHSGLRFYGDERHGKLRGFGEGAIFWSRLCTSQAMLIFSQANKRPSHVRRSDSSDDRVLCRLLT